MAKALDLEGEVENGVFGGEAHNEGLENLPDGGLTFHAPVEKPGGRIQLQIGGGSCNPELLGDIEQTEIVATVRSQLLLVSGQGALELFKVELPRWLSRVAQRFLVLPLGAL